MHVDFLIIGQGICGTWLSYFLQQQQQSFLVIDNKMPDAASRVAAGIINPVTGRRIVKTWMIDELLPLVNHWYHELGEVLQLQAISQKNIIDFFPTPQMMLAFNDRLQASDNSYLKTASPEPYQPYFNFDFSYGEIDPVFMVHLDAILPAWRQRLLSQNGLLQDNFDINLLIPGEKIQYKDITASYVIFCDGVNSFYNNPFFNRLPFAPNKGEVLLIEAAGLPANHIYKKGLTLAPLAEQDLFWMGSNYLWDFTDHKPSALFYQRTEAVLKEWLKMPFKIIGHRASIRPATLERRPFVGLHPLQKNIGILNGMGTKGCSLAPFFANELVQHILNGKDIHPEGNISRFQKILSK